MNVLCKNMVSADAAFSLFLYCLAAVLITAVAGCGRRMDDGYSPVQYNEKADLIEDKNIGLSKTPTQEEIFDARLKYELAETKALARTLAELDRRNKIDAAKSNVLDTLDSVLNRHTEKTAQEQNRRFFAEKDIAEKDIDVRKINGIMSGNTLEPADNLLNTAEVYLLSGHTGKAADALNSETVKREAAKTENSMFKQRRNHLLSKLAVQQIWTLPIEEVRKTVAEMDEGTERDNAVGEVIEMFLLSDTPQKAEDWLKEISDPTLMNKLTEKIHNTLNENRQQ